jgi:hypothetical protein
VYIAFPSGLTSLISHSVEVVTDVDYYREVRNRRDADFYREPQPVDESDKTVDVIVDELAEE